jgi:hypothetical protein
MQEGKIKIVRKKGGKMKVSIVSDVAITIGNLKTWTKHRMS